MATTTKSNLYPTLTDLMDRLDPNGNMADIVEVLNETNEMLADLVWVMANSKFSHKTTVRAGIPMPTWRRLNYGVKPTKSQTKQIVDTCGMLEALAVVDKKLAELNGMKASWRVSENAAFIEGMGQELQRAILYGDSSKDPEKIMGLAPRFSTVNRAKAASADNVIDCGGTGSNLTSIWLVGWGPKTVHGIYPENSVAGLREEDYGEETQRDEEGGEYRVLKTHYEWDVGLTVRDWRYVVRIANISEAMLLADPTAGGALDLFDKLTDATLRVPSLTGARFAFYANRKVIGCLRKQQKNAKNVNLTLEQNAGKAVTSFDGIPIRTVDALTFAESQVK